MWEQIGKILTGPNAAMVLMCILILALLIVIAADKGFITIHTKVATISSGAADREREIIRQQTEWIKLHLEGMEMGMHKPDYYDPWRGKFIVEAVYDEYVAMITYNHLSTDSAYVDVKADKIVSIVHKYVEKPEFQSEEFEEWLREDTRANIAKLIQIRKLFKK